MRPWSITSTREKTSCTSRMSCVATSIVCGKSCNSLMKPQTMLVATHDIRLVQEVFSRVLVMDHGRIVADGATDAILGDAVLLARHGLEL